MESLATHSHHSSSPRANLRTLLAPSIIISAVQLVVCRIISAIWWLATGIVSSPYILRHRWQQLPPRISIFSLELTFRFLLRF